MTATDFATILLSSATISSVLAAALVWLLQTWIGERLKNDIRHEYDVKLESLKAQLKVDQDREIEVHKARLASENAEAIEQLKANLQITASEHQIRFAKLHEKVAEVVAETYSLLHDQLIAGQSYVSVVEWKGELPKKEKREKVAKAMEAFDQYFRRHRLYLPKDIADQIKTFEDELFELTREFMVHVEAPRNETHSTIEVWSEIAKKVNNGTRPLFESLEDEFRKLLGVGSE